MELYEAMERIRILEPPVAREAIQCIRENKEEAIPLLLERLRDSLQKALTEYEEDGRGTEGAYWYPLYLLAEFRVHEAFEPLAALLEYDDKKTDWFLCDALTEDFPCVLASCAQPDDLARLRELSSLDGPGGWLLTRNAALKTACILFAEGDITREDILALIRDTLAQAAAKNDCEMVSFAMVDAVKVGLFDMKDEIRLLFEQGKTDPQIIGDWEDFSRYSRFEQSPAAALREYRQHIYHRKIDNVVAVIESWPSFKPIKTAAPNVLATPQEERESQKRPAAASKTGPNDPCPCGSGKKYKKCCMFK